MSLCNNSYIFNETETARMFRDLEDTDENGNLIFAKDLPKRTEATIHPFQTKGLGIAPFRFDELTTGKCRCDFCNTPIKNIYNIVSKDRKKFVVGSECIKKVADQDLIKVVKVHEKKRRQLAKAKKLETLANDYKQSNPAIIEWLEESISNNNNFAISLMSSINKYGGLTDGQENAVLKSLNKECGPRTQNKIDNYKSQYPAVYKWIVDNSESNGFAKSLLNSLNYHGSLTQGQTNAVVRQIDSQNSVVSFDKNSFDKIVTIFSNAKAAGLKRPKLTVDGVQLSLAPITGKNAGCLYVKTSGGYGDYLGKITADGQFYKSRECEDNNIKTIEAIAHDPLAKAVEHGRKTGNCACCSRPLTNKESVEIGIGPVCKVKWGL